MKRGKYGFHSICHECQRSAKATRRLANLEIHRGREREYARERRAKETDADKLKRSVWQHGYYLANRDTFNERAKTYRAAHRDEIIASVKAYQSNHRDYYRALKRRPDQRQRISEYCSRWRRGNKAKCREYNARRKALKLQAQGDHTSEDITRKLSEQDGRCFYCEIALGIDWQIDHFIPLIKGGSNYPDNIVVACKHCNCSKKDKLPWEWDGWSGQRPTP